MQPASSFARVMVLVMEMPLYSDYLRFTSKTATEKGSAMKSDRRFTAGLVLAVVLASASGYDEDRLRFLPEAGGNPAKTLYGQRHKVENLFGRLKDW